MQSPRFVSALLAGCLAGCLALVPAAEAQVRRQGPPPRPFTRSEMASASTEVPMIAGPEVLLEVRIDGKGPFRFALDTGAAGGGRISSALTKTLGLKVVGQAMAGDPTGKNRQTIEIVEAGSLAVGGATFSGVQLGVRDFPSAPGQEKPGFDGILGIGLFEEHLLTLDYPGQRVRIEKGELPAADGREVVDFQNPRGIPVVRLKVGDLELDADVDSGNQRGELVLPASYLGKVPLAKDPVVVGRGRTVSNEFEIKQAPLKGAVRLGGQAVEGPLVDFVEGFPHANLGHAFLRRFAVTIDQKNHRIRFRTPAAQGS
ncbi:MAG TPA: retropepsin-like aspartic protease [Thermoanaerobaculia bacterium]|nr:retropepsin-like aspartic protease [Thermoanaerobaculia bacterium]